MRAIEVKNHSTLNGKVIRVSWSHRDSDVRRSGTGNVFIKVPFKDWIAVIHFELLIGFFPLIALIPMRK